MTTKEFARHWLPPALVTARRRYHQWCQNRRVGEAWFREWWRTTGWFLSPPDLCVMMRRFLDSPVAALLSKYWWTLCRADVEALHAHGYDWFKQTVARHYYTWVGTDAPVVRDDVLQMNGRPYSVSASELVRCHACWTQDESLAFNLNTLLLYSFFMTRYRHADELQEPTEGGPPFIFINGHRISQDTLFGYLDYRTITACCDVSKVTWILEIGAGYGRTAYQILTRHPGIGYVIVDVPPALYVAERYLRSQFPGKAKTLQFLLPHELDRVEHVDLVLAIDCLHAMTPAMVQWYFEQIDRIADRFYFTHWPSMTIPYDDVCWGGRFPIKSQWKHVYRQPALVPSCYVNEAYALR